MNICLISKEYPPETGWGGIGTYTYNMANALSYIGNEVHVIAQAVDVDRDYIGQNVHIHRIKQKRIPSPFLRYFLQGLRYSLQISKLIKSINCKFDIIEAPEWNAECFVQSFSTKPTLVTRLHTPRYMAELLNNGKMSHSARTIDFLEKKQTNNSRGITSPTMSLAKKVSQYWNIDPSVIEVIPNGIDIRKIRSIRLDNNPLDTEYLLYIGRLEKRKGVHILAKALPGIFKEYPDLKMVFIGDDMIYGTESMKEFILNINYKYKKNLFFTGFIPDKEKYTLIKNCKFVVLPSLWENFPYTCLEAMTFGKTIIATKGSGYDEIVDNGHSGFLVEPGSYSELEKAIITQLEKNIRIEKNVLKRCEDFDIFKISKKLITYYEKILG